MSMQAGQGARWAYLAFSSGSGGGVGRARVRRSIRVALDLLGALDILAVVLAVLLATLLVAWQTGVTVHWVPVLQCGLLAGAILHFVLRSRGDYRGAGIEIRPERPLALLGSFSISALALFGLGSPFVLSDVRLWLWYAAWISIGFPMLLATRAAGRRWLTRRMRAGTYDTRVAIYGGGRVAERLAEHAKAAGTGVKLVGVFDDRAAGDRGPRSGPPVDGTLDDLIAVGRRELIDQIVIALPPAADHRLASMVCKLEQLPVSLHVCSYIASDVYAQAGQHRVSTLGPLGLIDIKKKPLSDWGPVVKALEDRLIGTLMLLGLLPVLVLIAIAIKLDSRGPVLFRQRRHGLNHRVVTVNKFRTMRVLEDGAEVAQATRNDPRVTRLGAFLRRTSLDELPQLFNVVRGEMSLVGPRPHALVHDEQWGELLERYANRFQVKPGITGWAQVNGYRGEIETTDDMRRRVEYDLAYINDWSLGLDLKILWRTLFVAFKDKKAY